MEIGIFLFKLPDTKYVDAMPMAVKNIGQSISMLFKFRRNLFLIRMCPCIKNG